MKATLVAGRMLFVGFSLDDPNFHRIAAQVRRWLRAGPKKSRREFGTTLAFFLRIRRRTLWEGDLDCVGMIDLPLDPQAKVSDVEFAEGTRLVEVFLDRVGIGRGGHRGVPARSLLLLCAERAAAILREGVPRARAQVDSGVTRHA